MDGGLPSPDLTATNPSPETGRISRAQGIAGIVAVTILVLLGLYTLREFIPAILWAVIFAISVWPLYRRAQKRWAARTQAGSSGRTQGHVLPLLFTLLVALVFILPLALIIVPLGREAQEVVSWVNQARKVGVPVPAFLPRMPFASHLIPLWQENLSDPARASDLLGRLGRSQLVSMSGHIGSQVLHRLVQFGFTLLTLFFLFRDGDALQRRLLLAARRTFGPSGLSVGRQVIASVHGTLDGLVLVGLGEGVILGIVYLLTGVPRPTLFGLVTAILSMIPFGAALAFWAAGGLLLVLGKAISAIVVVGVGLIVTFVADHFIRPVLIGGATRLPFIWVLFGILGGIESFGLLGLFVGPAVMAVLILLWREWVGEKPGPINP